MEVFADWLETWLTTIAPRTVSQRTLGSTYEPKVRRWIVPQLGRIAWKRGKVGSNVGSLVDAPVGEDVDIEPLTRDEARRILAAAASHRNGARWSVALAVGIRQSEAIGLRWQYVDLDPGTIEVGWQLQRARYRHGCDNPATCTKDRHLVPCPPGCTRHNHRADCPENCSKRSHSCPPVKRPCRDGCTRHARECPQRIGGGWHFTRRKGVKAGQGKSKLVLALPAPLLAQLRAHRREQAAERLTAGASWQDWDLVFCTPTGAPVDSRDDWEDWHALLKEAGVREARVHDARHTAATLLLEQGIGIRVVQQILGHSQLSQTQRYTHVTAELTQHAADRMGEALWG